MRPSRAVIGWLVGSAASASIVAGIAAILIRWLGLAVPIREFLIVAAWTACATGFTIGLVTGTSADIRNRLARTHRELPGARTPVAWAYAVVLATAAATVASFFVLAPTESIPWAIATASVAATGACAAAGLGGLLRFGLDHLAPAAKPADQTTPERRPYFTDEPISDKGHDELDRSPVVEALLEAIERTSGPTPAFISLEGQWGSGKSSVVTLVRSELDKRGWLHGTLSGFHFAARERLVEAFLETMSRTVTRRYATTDVRALLVRLWATSRPIVDRLSPLGVPADFGGPAAANAHLRSLIELVPRPVVIFIEDVDRLSGADVMTLISALLTAGDLPRFVFVLVMDRGRVEAELAKQITDGPGYLRKIVNAAIRVPPPPPKLLVETLDRYIEDVLAARQTRIEPGELATISRGTWTTLVPTLRHAKHLANAFSAALNQVVGEVSTRDVLLLAVLEELAPAVLSTIATHPALWLRGRDAENLLEGLLIGRPSSTERAKHRATAIEEAEPDEIRRGAINQLVALLLPDQGDDLQLLRDQRVVEYEYFRRYVERRVAPGKVRDQQIIQLVDTINRADTEDVQQILVNALRELGRYTVLDRLVVLAELLDERVRDAIVEAIAKSSLEFAPSDTSFVPAEHERARALIFRLLELGKADPDRQVASMELAIRSSSSLEFARELVGMAKREHNAILTDFDALEKAGLEQVLSEETRRRLDGGDDPFATEPRYAPYILATLKDRRLAAEYAANLGRVEDVLGGYVEPEFPPFRMARIRWSSVCEGFDVNVLRARATPGTPLVDEMLRTERPCPDEEPTPASEESA